MSFKQSDKILVITIQTRSVDDEFKPDWQTETDCCLSRQSSPAEQKMEALLIQTMMSSLLETTGEGDLHCKRWQKSVSIQSPLEIQ